MFRNLKNVLRRLGWREYPARELARFLLYCSARHDPAELLARLNLPEGEQADTVRQEVLDPDPYRFTEYVIRLTEPVSVEPIHGMVVASGHRLISGLFDVHRTVAVPPPSLFGHCLSARRPIEVEEAILLRHHYGEDNYFHFYSDVLSKFAMFPRHPEMDRLPLIVSRRQFDMPFFQAMIRRARLEDRTWIVQDGQCVRVQRLWCIKSRNLTRAWIEHLWEFLRIPEPVALPARRIYLRRGTAVRRPMQNQTEVEALLRSADFETVDTALMSLDQQIELFATARYVVAEHGAGCVNIIHRRGAPLALLELFPPRHVSTAFFLISHILGYEYRCLRGSLPGDGSDGFRMDLSQVESATKAMCHA